ncbi:hypothetical protein DEO72_LG4g585 [Vigna unguiculata]|uniref:Uncharacterized protein n=1 Tax=Vigna unguiculata TaxID=3917 RepID=A0A4D6LLI3_VIGUN|nr:hypothetical protein DEO72_LG4g585 [Vigna unguiculata]
MVIDLLMFTTLYNAMVIDFLMLTSRPSTKQWSWFSHHRGPLRGNDHRSLYIKTLCKAMVIDFLCHIKTICKAMIMVFLNIEALCEAMVIDLLTSRPSARQWSLISYVTSRPSTRQWSSISLHQDPLQSNGHRFLFIEALCEAMIIDLLTARPSARQGSLISYVTSSPSTRQWSSSSLHQDPLQSNGHRFLFIEALCEAMIIDLLTARPSARQGSLISYVTSSPSTRQWSSSSLHQDPLQSNGHRFLFIEALCEAMIIDLLTARPSARQGSLISYVTSSPSTRQWSSSSLHQDPLQSNGHRFLFIEALCEAMIIDLLTARPSARQGSLISYVTSSPSTRQWSSSSLHQDPLQSNGHRFLFIEALCEAMIIDLLTARPSARQGSLISYVTSSPSTRQWSSSSLHQDPLQSNGHRFLFIEALCEAMIIDLLTARPSARQGSLISYVTSSPSTRQWSSSSLHQDPLQSNGHRFLFIEALCEAMIIDLLTARPSARQGSLISYVTSSPSTRQWSSSSLHQDPLQSNGHRFLFIEALCEAMIIDLLTARPSARQGSLISYVTSSPSTRQWSSSSLHQDPLQGNGH